MRVEVDGMNFSEKIEANTMTTRHHGDVCFVLRWSFSFYPSDSGLTGPKSTSAQQNGQSSFHRPPWVLYVRYDKIQMYEKM